MKARSIFVVTFSIAFLFALTAIEERVMHIKNQTHRSTDRSIDQSSNQETLREAELNRATGDRAASNRDDTAFAELFLWTQNILSSDSPLMNGLSRLTSPLKTKNALGKQERPLLDIDQSPTQTPKAVIEPTLSLDESLSIPLSEPVSEERDSREALSNDSTSEDTEITQQETIMKPSLSETSSEPSSYTRPIENKSRASSSRISDFNQNQLGRSPKSNESASSKSQVSRSLQRIGAACASSR